VSDEEHRQCRPMTAECFPDKLTVQEFMRLIIDAKTVDAFMNNMSILNRMEEKRWPEDWMQTFLEWLEMEKE